MYIPRSLHWFPCAAIGLATAPMPKPIVHTPAAKLEITLQ